MPKIENLFRQGDLLFGLLAKRQPYVEKLKARRFSDVIANDLNMPLVRDLMNDKFSPKYIADLKPNQRSYAQLLEYKKDYLFGAGGKDVKEHVDATERKHMIAIRRACKLLIWSAAKLKTRSIHFVLDDIDHHRVASKRNLSTGKYDPAISGAELREAYRDRKFASSGDRRPSFFFYREKDGCLETVLPPWKDPDLREDYDTYKRERAAHKRQRTTDPSI